MDGELLKLVQVDDSDALNRVAFLRDVLARLEEDPYSVSGVAVSITFKNGAASTAYDGEDYMRMVGAVDWCKRRLLDEWQAG